MTITLKRIEDCVGFVEKIQISRADKELGDRAYEEPFQTSGVKWSIRNNSLGQLFIPVR